MSTYYYKSLWYFQNAIILLIFVIPPQYNAQNTDISNDFEKHLRKAHSDSFPLNDRKRFVNVAYTLIKQTPDDSLKYERISDIVEIISKFKDSTAFHKIALVGHKLANELNSPEFLGDSHWNYAAYYLRKKEYELSYAHYQSAYKYFTSVKNEYYAGKMLYNMAFISSQTYDYTGAEILLFESIKLFENTHSYLQLYRCYNLLGTIADDMEEYDKGLIYYTKASKLINKLQKSRYYQLQNYNNLGVRLIKMKQFEEAATYFNKALLSTDGLKRNPSLLAKLLDNKAYCLISLGIHEPVVSFMQEAITLRDSIGDTSGSVISRLRFANYYGKIGDSLKAIASARDALKLARANNLKRDVLQAFEFLANYDRTNTISYLQEYIILNKKINAQDRNLRNKFTAIRYETETYILENEKLLRQKLWILFMAIATITILFLIYLNSRQRAKNKELLFERQEQQYNEDMYLMALAQKTHLEKGKSAERKRISQELHDDILSRLFALRFRWQAITLTGETTMVEQHRQFLNLLEKLETDIRNLSHEFRNMLFFREENFLDKVETLVKEKSQIGNFTFSYDYKQAEDWENISFITKINLHRFFEEVLQNVVKHSRATKVDIELYRDMELLKIKIIDNGKGFGSKQIKKGIGIKNLENRSSKLKGNLEVQSKLNVGTVICLSIPINN